MPSFFFNSHRFQGEDERVSGSIGLKNEEEERKVEKEDNHVVCAINEGCSVAQAQ